MAAIPVPCVESEKETFFIAKQNQLNGTAITDSSKNLKNPILSTEWLTQNPTVITIPRSFMLQAPGSRKAFDNDID